MTGTPPSAGGPSAGWYPDPQGRFTHRYWDGSRWTEHVSDAAGQRSTDPIAAVAPAGVPRVGAAPVVTEEPFPTDERRYQPLRLFATILIVMGWITLVGGELAVIIAAVSAAGADDGGGGLAALVFLPGTLGVAFFGISVLAAGYLYRLWTDLEANTRWTARLVAKVAGEQRS